MGCCEVIGGAAVAELDVLPVRLSDAGVVREHRDAAMAGVTGAPQAPQNGRYSTNGQYPSLLADGPYAASSSAAVLPTGGM
ncbi:MAG: hypothetical protein ACT4QD_09065 [Acidobacteriota bacterium]